MTFLIYMFCAFIAIEAAFVIVLSLGIFIVFRRGIDDTKSKFSFAFLFIFLVFMLFLATMHIYQLANHL